MKGPVDMDKFTKGCVWGAFSVTVLVIVTCLVIKSLDRRNQSRYETTAMGLNYLQKQLYCYALDYGCMPDLSFVDCIEQLRESGYLADAQHYQVVLNAKDAWGRSLIYDRVNEYKVVIRSIGANGIDDQGGSDDIQRTIVTPIAFRIHGSGAP